MERSLNFNIERLNFELKIKWEPEKKGMVLASTPQGVSVGFICEEALAIGKQIIPRGLLPAEPFVGNNMWVVTLKDPDGYNIYYESATVITLSRSGNNLFTSKDTKH